MSVVENMATQQVEIQDTEMTGADSGSTESKYKHKFDKYCKASIKMLASDIHLKANNPPRFRTSGALKIAKADPLINSEIEEMIFEILKPEQIAHYKQYGSIDFAYAYTEDDRFRVNAFKQRGLMSVAARRISKNIMDYEQLHLPNTLAHIANLHQGLILLAGITGSGKSTTIAAMMEQINKTRSCHIVTIEDPIEYLFKDKKAFINQREIGIDAPNFAAALKSLMREDPDVVLIGEMRDAETFSAAIQAAESGHLSFATVHASTTAGTITRILELFPEEARDLVRTSLAMNLKAVICQKLLPSIKSGASRLPAIEIMLCNSTIRKFIEEKRESDINSVLKSCYNEGMVDFNEYLRQMIENEWITPQTGFEASPNADELKMKLKGIKVSGGGMVG